MGTLGEKKPGEVFRNEAMYREIREMGAAASSFLMEAGNYLQEGAWTWYCLVNTVKGTAGDENVMKTEVLKIPLCYGHVAIIAEVGTWLLGFQCLVGWMSDDMEETDEDVQVVITEVEEVGVFLSEHLDGGCGVKGGRSRLFQQMVSAVRRRIINFCRNVRNLQLAIVTINKELHWGMITVKKNGGDRCVLTWGDSYFFNGSDLCWLSTHVRKEIMPNVQMEVDEKSKWMMDTARFAALVDGFSCGLYVVAFWLMFSAEGNHLAHKLVEQFEGIVVEEIRDIAVDKYIHSILTVQNLHE